MSVQAILLAGDRGAAKAVKGRSKAFIEVAGKPMLVHVLESLLHTPEVGEVFIVGDAIRLEKVVTDYGCLQLAARRSCPIHIVPQRNSLFENVWHTFLRTLPPERKDDEHPVLVVPADIPLVIPEEFSDFIQQAEAADADYVLGMSTDVAMAPFGPTDETPGIEMAYFCLAEGRFRQNNLHYVRPLKIGNRHYVQDMYENRYQKQFGSIVRLGWRILVSEFRNLHLVFTYLLMHLAGVLDRRGHARAAAWVGRRVPLPRAARGVGRLLRTRFVTVTTGLGGAAIDVDNDHDLEVVDKMLEPWKAMQLRNVEAGRLPPPD
jgi:GTP:adenosylcobinamide-phosphate guanylyltransferase